MTRRQAMTDSQWQAIQDKIPGKPGDPGQNNRLFVEAVFFVAKTGIPWADLHERFGKPNSLGKRFDRWAAKGVWPKLISVLGVPELEELLLDSTRIKAHPVSAAAKLPSRKSTCEKTSPETSTCNGSFDRRQAPELRWSTRWRGGDKEVTHGITLDAGRVSSGF